MTDDRRLDRAKGLWRLREEVPVEDDHGGVANDAYIFMYSGDTVTLRLMTLRTGQWKTPDDFYTLEAKWEGDSLYYRPPFGDWTDLAAFEGDHFVNIGSGKRRVFAKITPDEVEGWNKAILKEDRQPHDYRIRADGSLATEDPA